MGFKRPETVYRLVFDGHDGLEVSAAAISLGRLFALAGQADSLRAGEAKSMQEAAEVFRTFASRLRGWNLEEDDGTPIPADWDGLASLEFSFASELLLAWFDAISDVPVPLERKSTGTSTSEELSIPMESWSGSPPS